MSPTQNQGERSRSDSMTTISLTDKRKCDGAAPCNNCASADVSCEYLTPRKRGPRPASSRSHSNIGQTVEEPLHSAICTAESAVAVQSESPNFPTTSGADTSHLQLSSVPLGTSATSTSSLLAGSGNNNSQVQAAITVYCDLLAALAVSVPSDTPASITDQCISLYTQDVFGALPMCHEAALRMTVGRFFMSNLAGDSHLEIRSQVSHLFIATDEPELVTTLRSLTLLTALCASVIYVVPEDVLPDKHLTGPLFLRAARDMLRIYEDYDLEHPDSSSLIIRLFLSTAVQTATGRQQLAFHILNEAGLVAMRLRLYDEASLEGLGPFEEKLRRNAFWQLYVCDHTALVMKGRPVTIHEKLFDAELSLEPRSQNGVSLFEHGHSSQGAIIEDRLLEGFHLIRRLWAIAARIIQAIESRSRSEVGAAGHSNRTCQCNDTAQLSEAYFDMITSTNDLYAWILTPTEAYVGDCQDSQLHTFDVLHRQRTSCLITLHSIKIFVLNCAVQGGLPEIVGLTKEPRALAMRQIELAQEFLNVLESVPFLHLRTEGESCVSRVQESSSVESLLKSLC